MTCLRIKDSHRGFTLLELLVVMVILSMLVTLLMQTVSYFLHARERALITSATLSHEGLREQWFRDSVRGLAPEGVHRPTVFQGNANGFHGISLSSPDHFPGTPMKISWQLEYAGNRTRLVFESEQTVWEVLEWQGHVGQFAYLDREGTWHDRWPPEGGLDGPRDELPQAILLDGERRTGPFLWAESPQGPRAQRADLRPREVF